MDVEFYSKEQATKDGISTDMVGFWIVSKDADGCVYDEVGPYQTEEEARIVMAKWEDK